MQTIYLDISNKGVVPTIYAKQGDIGRKFLVVLTDAGVPYATPDGSAFSVWYEGDSGSGNYTDIGNNSAFSVNANTVSVEMIVQMLENAGDGILCLVLNAPNGNQISSWNIPYVCESVPGYKSEAAESYFTAFSQAVANLPYPDSTLSISGKSADAEATGSALAAKAPAGFGLGREEGYFVTDLDDAKVNGWFYCGDGTLHVPPLIHNSAYAAGFVISRSYQDFTQFVVVGSASTHETTLAAMRSYANGTYGEWEYINPPMLAGVEYRTTERYNGKAVYAAHIKYTCSAEVGNASGFSSLYIPAGLPNSKLVRVEGTVNEKRPFPVMTPSGGMVTIDHFWDSGELSLQFNKASFPEGTSFYFMIYYTKY